MQSIPDTLYISNWINTIDYSNETKLLFHGITGAIDEIGKTQASILQDNIDREITKDDFSLKNLEILYRRGYLTRLAKTEQIERLEQVVGKLHAEQLKKKDAILLIALSYDCNLNCSYCYQQTLHNLKSKQGLLAFTPEKIDQLFNRTIPQMFGGSCKSLEINLYGGEPFLPRHLETISKICEYTTKRRYRVSAETNGVYLHRFLHLLGLSPGMITELQISIDGLPKDVRSSSTEQSRENCFYKIIENAKQAAQRVERIGLRVNISSENIGDIKDIIAALEKLEIPQYEKIHVYFKAVHEVAYRSPSIDFPEILSQYSLSKYLANLNVDWITSPLETLKDEISQKVMEGKPFERINFCMHNRPNSFIVDPYLNVYGCLDEAGFIEKSIGRIEQKGYLTKNEVYNKNQSRLVTKYEPCRSCSLALTCGGGCPSQAELTNGTIFSDFCDSHKEMMREAILAIYDENKEEI